MAVATAESQSVERGYQRLSSLFRPTLTEGNSCHRCKAQVYHAEKIGPVHEVVFHRNCFKCVVCGQFLTIKNYFSNQTDASDREVYCGTHVPRIGGTHIDERAMGIKNAINSQNVYKKMSKKMNSEVRLAGTLRKPNYNYEAVAIKRATTVPKTQDYVAERATAESLHKGVDIDANALYIKGPIEAQLLRQGYQRKLDKHHYPPNIYKKRKKLIEEQRRLEAEYKREEDRLLDEFQNERKQEKRRLSAELQHEWESRLKELTEKFDKEFGQKKKKMKDSERKQMTIHFENKKREIEVVIQEKKKKKQETMTLRLKEKEQKKTATMVARQSRQMLEILAQKQDELKQELKQEMAAESKVEGGTPNGETEEIEEAMEALEIIPVAPTEIPSPHPPSCRKKDLYVDPSQFNDIDEQTIKVAENEQPTYTDLVQQLTENLVTDLEKARAIYRWVTVKDLNVMEFEESIETDTPMGLLRGIKYGTETYHVLFMRLCSYAGLHCEEIKGHSKSVGYEPGMKIKPDQFQNTWNAVLIDGDWRLVQCNWGARHLVLNKDKKSKDKPKPKSKDQIRYQYDEHYFLTDPDEFIQEFWAADQKWQLLESPITLEEFEALPFVRSIFFHYGMRFEKSLTAVLETSEKGGTEVKIKIPEEFENDLVFYYQMRYADKEKRQEATYKGANLERFVFQTMLDNTVMFSIHVPAVGEYFFEVFANKIEESSRLINAEETTGTSISPFRLKCTCKFKVVCNSLSGKMYPLPDCASGEWGPKKAYRHFGLKVLQTRPGKSPKSRSSPDSSEGDRMSDSGSSSGDDPPENPKAGILNVDDTLDIKLKMPRPLHVVAKLKMNNVDTKTLDTFISTKVEKDIIHITGTLPQVGQYGLDIYGRPKEAGENTTLSHAMKYLINCLKVANPVELPKTIEKQQSTIKKEKWGPQPTFESLGIKAVSPKDPKITLTDVNTCTIEIQVPDDVIVTHQFFREPDTDVKDNIAKLPEKGGTIKYHIDLPQTGNYMLSLFGRRKEEDEMPNIYNYLIVYRKPGDTNGPQQKEERRGSSIFKKGFFKKSEKK
ncbi:hillarin-like [Saccostrea cucullata]|uniref:hillarin-like n=2 Tax=Saccostrea cuccullata TaxID=36930 RepID=UPI002ED627FC